MSTLENIKSSIHEGRLTEIHVAHLLTAYNEDSASAINWLISILKLIKSRLENNLSITISQNSNVLILETTQQLADWIVDLFPEIARDC